MLGSGSNNGRLAVACTPSTPAKSRPNEIKGLPRGQSGMTIVSTFIKKDVLSQIEIKRRSLEFYEYR